MNTAPITLFVYNRPHHTLQTLEYLSKNRLANQSKLIIYCDGPRKGSSEVDLRKIHEVRKQVKSAQWCKEVEIVESEENKGLAASIVGGITEVVNTYGKVIMLEDDMLTSPGFLTYMNDSLNVYADEEKVMHISAYIQPFPRYYFFPETFFFRVPTCSGGWGVWKESWAAFNPNMKYLYEQIQNLGKEDEFFLDNNLNFIRQVEKNIDGSMNTWFIKWYAVNFLQQGLSLHPGVSLVRNIGWDGSGENTGSTSIYAKQRVAHKIRVKKIPQVEDQKMLSYMKRFYFEDMSIRGKLYKLIGKKQ
jgi:hypothetical protein